jgi:hypothetical protein
LRVVAAVSEGLLQQGGVFEGVAELLLQVGKVLLAGGGGGHGVMDGVDGEAA